MKGRIFYFPAESQRKGFMIGVGISGIRFGRRDPSTLIPILMGDLAGKKKEKSTSLLGSSTKG
jgi:hypothetical protein